MATSAEKQMRAFIDRILPVKAKYDFELARAIENRLPRLEYVFPRLADVKGMRGVALDKAFVKGAMLLGMRTDTVRDRVKIIRRRGSLAAALAYFESWMEGPVWDVGPLDGDLFGFVYAMAAPDYPGIFKVGFSRSPRQRLVALQRQYRIRLELLHYVPGTEFDEHLVQDSIAEHALAGEWFDMDGRWRAQNPMRLFMLPEFMWADVRAAS